MLTVIFSLFGFGFIATAIFAGVSWHSQRHLTHIPRDEDSTDPAPQADTWLVETICRWQDRHALRIFQVVLFFVCLQILKACTQP